MTRPDSPDVLAELIERHADAGKFCVYRWRNVGIFVWSDAPTIDTLASYERCSSELISEHPEGFSAVNVLVPGGRLPTSEVRSELSRITDLLGEHVAGMAVLVLGAGFWASALRGLMTAIHMLMRKPIDLQVFSSAEDTAHWLVGPHAQRTNTNLDPNQLISVLRHIAARAALETKTRGREVA